jgi:hypothetical protein
MSHDPLSHVASWLTPSTGDPADPLLAMVAKQAQLQEASATLEDEAGELLSSLSVSVQFAGETFTGTSEEQLRSFISRRENRRLKFWREFLEDAPDFDIRTSIFAVDPKLKNLTDEEAANWRDKLMAKIAAADQEAEQAMAEFQAGRKRAEEAFEASDYKKLRREADALAEQIEDFDEQIEKTVAISFAGVLAQIEFLRESFGDHALIDTIITGVQRLAGGAA